MILKYPPPLPSLSPPPHKRRRTIVCLEQLALFSFLQIQVIFDWPAPIVTSSIQAVHSLPYTIAYGCHFSDTHRFHFKSVSIRVM